MFTVHGNKSYADVWGNISALGHLSTRNRTRSCTSSLNSAKSSGAIAASPIWFTKFITTLERLFRVITPALSDLRRYAPTASRNGLFLAHCWIELIHTPCINASCTFPTTPANCADITSSPVLIFPYCVLPVKQRAPCNPAHGLIQS